jgi:tRNA modification GTPase
MVPNALPARHAVLGNILAPDGARIDEALALMFPSPHSYTGEDVVEFHVHGSPIIARDTLTACLSAGARLAEPGEFTRRAFEAGKLDLVQAEAVADLISAEHSSAARAAAGQLSGGLSREVDRCRSRLDALLERLAAAVDFPDEVDLPSREEAQAEISGVRSALGILARSWEHGRLVREGANVVIVGSPNAGKSSLLNALLASDRALVSEVAGTTRDTIEETLVLEKCVVRLIDTAGIRTEPDPLEAAGIARSEAALAQARLALIVVDASRPLDEETREFLLRTRARRRLLYYNKADLGREAFDAREDEEREAVLGSVFDPEAISAVRCELQRSLLGDERPDLERPHLASARQADAVLEADRALTFAERTLRNEDPLDLLVGDLLNASASLRSVGGRDASEALLTGIFARFCLGK